MLATRNVLHTVFLPLIALSAGVLGMCAIWVTAAVLSHAPQAWLALLVAIDLLFLLRLSGVRPGLRCALLAVLTTALTCVASYWMIAATQFGTLLGLSPWESATRLGPVLARELTLSQAGPYDAALLGLALLIAAVAGYGPRRR